MHDWQCAAGWLCVVADSKCIYGALQEMQDELRCSADQIMDVVDQRVHEFFEKSLQLDVAAMRLEHQPDALEAI